MLPVRKSIALPCGGEPSDLTDTRSIDAWKVGQHRTAEGQI